MRWLSAVFTGLFFSTCPAAFADPLAIASIPADARWVIHLDVDAGSKTPLWELARSRIVQPQREQIMPRLEVLQKLTGLNLPQDMHDISLYGSTYDESAACILIHAAIDQDRTLTFLKLDHEFSSEDHNGHAVITWRDKQRDLLMYGAFFGKDLAVVARSPKIVALALDTLDGKSPALKADSPLAPPPVSPATGRQPFFWIAGANVPELTRLKKTESPLLGQVDAASVGGSWSDEKLTARLKVLARSEKTAQQMMALAEGVKAMVALAAADDHATPASRAASAALQGLTITSDGRHVTGEWTLSVDRIETLINSAKEDAIPTVPTNAAAQSPRRTDNKP